MLDASMYNALSVFIGAGVYKEDSGMDELRPGEERLASVPSSKQSDVVDPSCSSKNVASVGTQWEDHIFEDHCYIKRKHSVTYVNQSTQCDTFKPPSLMNDYDSNLYTGLPLHTFHTLVVVLHPHGYLVYQTEIEQQILLKSEVQRPRNLDSRSESYSHYYACNSIRYLVAIAPCGLVMFISAAYGEAVM